MGAQSSMLALVGAAGVTASKMAQGISEANDGNKNKQMASKARKNRDDMIAAKNLQKETLKQREKVIKGVISGFNQDPKTKINVMQEMRER